MNLSPAWVPVLRAAGYDARHWSAVGDPRAPDPQIMEWARAHGHVVFTHDLDYGTLLATTRAEGPSVIKSAPRM
jgi:predicted nuclease of predicted toxin-antitoxin system